MSVLGPTGSPPVLNTTPISPSVSLPQPPVPLDSPADPVAEAPETSNVSSPPPPPPVVSDSPPGDTARDPETSNVSSPPPPSPVESESPPGNTAPAPNSSSPTMDSNSDPSSSSTPEAHLTSPSFTFSPPPPPSSLALDAQPSAFSLSSGGVSTAVMAGVAVGGVVLLVVLGVLLICCARKRKRGNDYGIEGYVMSPSLGKGGQNGGSGKHWRQQNPASADYNQMAKQNSTPHVLNNGGGSRSNITRSSNSNVSLSSGMAINFSKSSFSYDELMMATNGFSDANLLGQGGFGYVHKGVLPNGKEVAVKSLKADEDQGDKEFQVEVETISRVHHKHLVTLVGYCITGPKRILVFEYVTNQTLEFHLHGRIQCRLDWPTRLKIALGAAKGLAYLHEDCHPKIIHRDIKAANILLDSNFEAKVADFGLAKMTNDANTHVSTRVMGTFGYLAPEYASSGKLTEKSDVFSFGVMLLELLTGRRPIDRKNPNMDGLVDWARPRIGRAMEDGNFDDVIDEQLEGNYNPDEIARMAACAISSVRHSARRRPKMSHIVRVLEGSMSLYELAEGVKQGPSAGYSTSDYGSGQYREDMKKMMKTALGSQDYGSGETGTTSDYGMYSTGSTSDSQGTQEMEMGKMRNNILSYNGSNRRN